MKTLEKIPNLSNAFLTKRFLLQLDKQTVNVIINDIAKTYQITTDEVFNELYNDEAECLLDYLSSEIRMGVKLLYSVFLSIKN